VRRLRGGTLIQISKTLRVDNRDALASMQLQVFLIYNGQYKISRQTRSPDSETIASQS
jgi:hypothetical protein